MAIFVALIFQVLFVFFAMVINIGLVVHDKINLQNAVDLSAYYAAQKQAEWLNVIAHQNYQIRQSFKLLTWRYRVLGTMGLTRGADIHPTRWSGNIPDQQAYPPGANPSACIIYKPVWQDVPKGDESVCQRRDFILPEISPTPIIATFNPINILLNISAKDSQRRIEETCKDYGRYNYIYVNLIKFLYRVGSIKIENRVFEPLPII